MMPCFPRDPPFSERIFHLNGKLVDIEDFISEIATTFEEATVIRSDLYELGVDYHMYFAIPGGFSTEHDIYRVK